MRSNEVFDQLLARRLVFLQERLDGAQADTVIAQMLHLDTLDPGLERVQHDAEREVWLSAAEAQAYGLIDEVVRPGTAGQDPDRPRS